MKIEFNSDNVNEMLAINEMMVTLVRSKSLNYIVKVLMPNNKQIAYEDLIQKPL